MTFHTSRSIIMSSGKVRAQQLWGKTKNELLL
jgi:hypothetical protein